MSADFPPTVAGAARVLDGPSAGVRTLFPFSSPCGEPSLEEGTSASSLIQAAGRAARGAPRESAWALTWSNRRGLGGLGLRYGSRRYGRPLTPNLCMPSWMRPWPRGRGEVDDVHRAIGAVGHGVGRYQADVALAGTAVRPGRRGPPSRAGRRLACWDSGHTPRLPRQDSTRGFLAILRTARWCPRE